jgi:hypothetical protein
MTLDRLYPLTLRTPLNVLMSKTPLFRTLTLANRDCVHRVQLAYCLGIEQA